MKIIKKENGNVLLTDGSGNTVKRFPEGAVIELENNGRGEFVRIAYGHQNKHDIYPSTITATQIEPDAEVAFSGTAQNLLNLLSTSFFFEVAGLDLTYNTDGYQVFDRIRQAYTTGTSGSDFLRARLIVVESDITIDEMAIHVTSGAVGNLVAGVYSVHQIGYPSDKLFQVPTEFDLSITGVQSISLTTPYLLKKGTYAVLELSSSSATYVRINPANLVNLRFDNLQIEQNVFGNPLAYTSTLPELAPSLSLLSTQIPIVAFGIQ